jgi:hypothetical protein
MYEVSGLQYEEAQAARHRNRRRPGELCDHDRAGFRSTAESTWAKCKYRGGDRRPPDAVVKRVLPEVSSDARESIQGTIRVTIRRVRICRSMWPLATFDYLGPSVCFADPAMQAAPVEVRSDRREPGTSGYCDYSLNANGFFVSSVL